VHAVAPCNYDGGVLTGGSAVVPHAATVTLRCPVGGFTVSATAMGPVVALGPAAVAVPAGSRPCTVVTWTYPSDWTGSVAYGDC
jgi:hypothetical protein